MRGDVQGMRGILGMTDARGVAAHLFSGHCRSRPPNLLTEVSGENSTVRDCGLICGKALVARLGILKPHLIQIEAFQLSSGLPAMRYQKPNQHTNAGKSLPSA